MIRLGLVLVVRRNDRDGYGLCLRTPLRSGGVLCRWEGDEAISSYSQTLQAKKISEIPSIGKRQQDVEGERKRYSEGTQAEKEAREPRCEAKRSIRKRCGAIRT